MKGGKLNIDTATWIIGLDFTTPETLQWGEDLSGDRLRTSPEILKLGARNNLASEHF